MFEAALANGLAFVEEETWTCDLATECRAQPDASLKLIDPSGMTTDSIKNAQATMTARA